MPAILAILWLAALPVRAAVGTEGASFLEIPVGGRPAALGGAYSAAAEDAYAPVWNPAGLGFLPRMQLSGMHLDYAQSIGYEFVSFVAPLGSAGRGLGASVQYLHPQDTTARDASGNDLGTYSSYYAAYSLAYGQRLGPVALGAAARYVDARISDVSAGAAAADVGAQVHLSPRLSFAAVAANLGGSLKFLQEGDRLPETYRLGLLYSPAESLSFLADGAYDATGFLSGRLGGEWRPLPLVALRVGYRSDAGRDLPGLSGLTMGVGLEAFGQRFDYAWVPMGQLGQTQYFSVVFTFGKGGKS